MFGLFCSSSWAPRPGALAAGRMRGAVVWLRYACLALLVPGLRGLALQQHGMAVMAVPHARRLLPHAISASSAENGLASIRSAMAGTF